MTKLVVVMPTGSTRARRHLHAADEQYISECSLICRETIAARLLTATAPR
jgi:hypothetical protein